MATKGLKRRGKGKRRAPILPKRVGSLAVLAIVLTGFCLMLAACGTCQRAPDDMDRTDDLSSLIAIDLSKPLPPVRVYLRSLAGEKATSWAIETKGVAKLTLANVGNWNLDASAAFLVTIQNGRLALSMRDNAEAGIPRGLLTLLKEGPQPITNRLSIEPLGEFATIKIGANEYEGLVDFSLGASSAPDAKSSARAMITNTVTMAQYVRGSLPSEMPAAWHIEALMAQAVAIRTYTFYTIMARATQNREWDVDDTTAYLRYAGVGGEGSKLDARYRKAISDAERGCRDEVMLHRGLLFKAYFHSTSGGHTTSCKVVFGDPAVPPLAGADLGNYGAESRMHRWKREFATDQVTGVVNNLVPNAGQQMGAVREIVPKNPRRGGWSDVLVVKGSVGTVEVNAAAFRRALGTGSDGLPSTNFEASSQGDKIAFQGRGWGHGVGLDQWAAQGMAKAGKTYRAILHTMYPECEVIRVRG